MHCKGWGTCCNVCVCVCVCARERACACGYMNTYTRHTSMHAHMHTQTHIYIVLHSLLFYLHSHYTSVTLLFLSKQQHVLTVLWYLQAVCMFYINTIMLILFFIHVHCIAIFLKWIH
jgi:hypothetical protein